jgi:hypothetical protein
VIEILDLDAEIVPGVGLGGFSLGANIATYQHVFRQVYSLQNGEESDLDWDLLSLQTPFEAVYRLPQLYEMSDHEFLDWDDAVQEWRQARERGEDVDLPPRPWDGLPRPDAVEIFVDVRDGTIFNLGALGAYRGPLLGSVETGITFAQAVERLPELLGTDEGFSLKGVEGMYGHLEPDPDSVPEEQIGESTITEIHVFLPGKGDRLSY